jgi:putative transposase
VLEEVQELQNRPLDKLYPIVFLDALRVKVRDEGLVRNKEQTEGAKFWTRVPNELKTPGVEDI